MPTDIEAKKNASQRTQTDFVWDPNRRAEKEYLITNIVDGPDTFLYGRIKVRGKVIDVYWSPFQHRWSR